MSFFLNCIFPSVLEPCVIPKRIVVQLCKSDHIDLRLIVQRSHCSVVITLRQMNSQRSTPSYSPLLLNSAGFAEILILSTELKLSQIILPIITCVKFMLLRSMFSLFGLDGAVSNMSNYCGVFTPKVVSAQIRLIWSTIYNWGIARIEDIRHLWWDLFQFWAIM